MKLLLTDRDADALFNNVAFISIDRANRLIEARLFTPTPTAKRKSRKGKKK